MWSVLIGGLSRFVRFFLPAPLIKAVRQRRSLRRVRRRFGVRRRPWAFLTGSALTVLFVPELPQEGHVAFKLCAVLGHHMTADPAMPFDVAIRHARGTYDRPAWPRDLDLPTGPAINGSCRDVSKSHVQQAFSDVFGYDLAVDPTTYQGEIVEKSDENARHDGRVLTGPIDPSETKPDRVYQRLVDNSSRYRGMVVDHRVPVYGSQIPLVYLKHRPSRTRFSNDNAFVSVAEVEDVLSGDERTKLVRLAEVLAIEFGEFDVLRDRDGRLYVVDAAKTPGGPPNGLPEDQARYAVKRLADAFDAFVRQRAASREVVRL